MGYGRDDAEIGGWFFLALIGFMLVVIMIIGYLDDYMRQDRVKTHHSQCQLSTRLVQRDGLVDMKLPDRMRGLDLHPVDW